MPVIKSASITNLKARIDIMDVVSTVVALKKSGAQFKGLSPFNAERTPSFYVSPAKGLYKCFSSGKAGDAISFVMETERLGFTEAVESLARRFNVSLEYDKGGISTEERSLRQELMDLHEEAAQAFRDAFLAPTEGGAFIRAYWSERRKFSPEVADDFKVGFAEPDGGRLETRLRKRGFSEEALRQCGLFYARGSGGLSPRFRGRLMIPIREHQGRIVAFTARQLEITPADDPAREAKYINSPETPVFTKGELLFNLDRARKTAGPDNPFLMVEGQLDAIRCWTAGLTATIAPQGTGVTDTQLHLLRRYGAALECLLDGDNAGQKAALRLLPLALREGIEISFLPLAGDGKVDPDDLVRERGAEAVHDLRRQRVGAMAFAVRALAPDPAALSAQQVADVCRELFAIIQNATSQVAQTEYIGEIASLLRLSRPAVESDFRRFRDNAARRSSQIAAAATAAPAHDSPGTPTAETTFSSAEQDLLLVLLHFETLGKPLAAVLQREWLAVDSRPGRLLAHFLNEFDHDLWPGADKLDELVDAPDDHSYLASLRFESPQIEDPAKVANAGIRQIVRNFCDPRIRKIELEIAAKQRNVDADLNPLLRTSAELRRLKLNPPTISQPV